MRTKLNILSLLIVLCIILTSITGCSNSKDTGSSGNETTSQTETKAENSTGAEKTEPEEDVYPENGLPKDPITLKVGFFEGGYGRAYYDYAKDTFTQKFPNVKIETVYSPKIDTVVQARIAANDVDEMFDLAPLYWSTYGVNKQIEPLNDLYERELYDTPGVKVKDILVDGAWDSRGEIDGNIYTFPTYMWVGGLFYDKALFKEHGWNEDPKTFDEFKQLCEDIKAKGITPITFSGMYNYLAFTVGWNKLYEIAEINGYIDEFTQKYEYDLEYIPLGSKEMLESWSKLFELGKAGYFSEGLASLNHTQSQMLAIQHKAAMVSSADWIDNEMKDSVEPGFEWGYMALPFINDPNQTIYLIGDFATQFGIWAAKPDINKKWAKEFMLWFLNKDVQMKQVEWAGALPVRKDIASDESKMASIRPGQKNLLTYLGTHKTKVVSGNRRVTPKTGPSAQQAYKLYTDGLVKVAEGKGDPEVLLKEIYELQKKGIEEGKQDSQ